MYGAELQKLQQLELWAGLWGNVPVVFGLVSGWLGPYPVLEEQHMAEKQQVRNVHQPLGPSCSLRESTSFRFCPLGSILIFVGAEGGNLP